MAASKSFITFVIPACLSEGWYWNALVGRLGLLSIPSLCFMQHCVAADQGPDAELASKRPERVSTVKPYNQIWTVSLPSFRDGVELEKVTRTNDIYGLNAQSSETESHQGNSGVWRWPQLSKLELYLVGRERNPIQASLPWFLKPTSPKIHPDTLHARFLSLSQSQHVPLCPTWEMMCVSLGLGVLPKIREQIANCLVLQGIKQSHLSRPSWCSGRPVLDQRQHTIKDRRH